MSLWDRFTGHPRAAQILRSVQRRPTGTYLFVGPAGAGKGSASLVFAASVLCSDACGECTTCSRVLRGLHPDVSILYPEGYTYPVETLRAGARAASQTPIEASHRVFIVQEADRIPERSQNALLKALEEPGSRVIWLLLARSLQPFLPTLLSRCQLVEFPPISEEAAVSLLRSRFGLEEQEAMQHLRRARGDIHAAVRLMEQPEAAQMRRRALELAAKAGMPVLDALNAAEEIRELVALSRTRAERQQAEELASLQEINGRDGSAAWSKRLGDRTKRNLRRAETEALMDFLAWMGAGFRDLAAASAGAESEALNATDHAESFAAAAPLRPTKFWVDMVEHCLQAQLALKNNASPAMLTESVLLRLV